MFVQMSPWIMAAVLLGQAPPESDWLKAIPADVDVALRSRGLLTNGDDLVAMLKAMSPALAEQAGPVLAGQLDQFRQKYGADAVTTPWISLMRVGQPNAEGANPIAILVKSDDYRGVLKAVAGGKEVDPKPQDGGYDCFDGPEGAGSWYAVKGPGFVAFGPDRTLIASVAGRDKKSLDQVLTPGGAEQFLAGDAGLYVNVATLAIRYAAQIDQARQTFMATLDQGGPKAGNTAAMDAAKEMYAGAFDALKYADALTLRLEVAPEGLHLAGMLTVKADSDAAKAIADAQTGSASDLARLAADAAFYVYMNSSPGAFDRLQGLGLRMMSPGGKAGPAQEEALAQFRALGRIATFGSATFADGMRTFNVVTVSDPRAYIAASQTMFRAMATVTGPTNFYKGVKIDADAETYRGFTFSHIVATLDLEKLAQLGPKDEASGAGMKSMFGGETLSYWIGTDGKRAIQVTTPSWDDAKAQMDAFLKDDGGVGSAPGYKSVRAQLPEQASLMMIVNAQGLVRLFAAQLAMTMKKPDLKVPPGLPEEPAFLGGSLTPRAPTGYEFHLVLPSRVGPVFEKGLVPLFRGLQPGNAAP